MTAKAPQLKVIVRSCAAMAGAFALATLAAACSPATKPDAAGAPTAVAPATAPGTASTADAAPKGARDLASFAKGEFKALDLTQKLPASGSPFVDAAGKSHTFAEWKGKTVVFNIWGEWCAPCVKEMPTLAALQKAFPNGDVVVLPIAFGDAKDQAKAEAKLKQLVGDALPFYYDASFNVTYDVKSGSFPTTIVYGPDGVERARLMLPADWSTPEAVGLVKAVQTAG